MQAALICYAGHVFETPAQALNTCALKERMNENFEENSTVTGEAEPIL